MFKRAVLIASLAAVAAAITPIPSKAAADTSAPPAVSCTLHRYASLDFATEPDGRIAVPLAFDDRKMLLMVDTGGAFGAISASAVQSLGLAQKPLPYGVSVEFYARVPLSTMVTVPTVQLGDGVVRDWQFLVSPDFMMPSEVSGILGANVLKVFDVEIDFAGGKVNLFSPDHCPGRVVYWTQVPYAKVPMKLDSNSHIEIPVALDGKPLTAVVDTGAVHSVMTVEGARELMGWPADKPLKKLSASKVNGEDRDAVYQFPFSALTFEGITVQNPDIVLVPEKDVARAAPSLILGASILRQLHVYIAYGEGNLYLTPAEAK